MELTNKFYKRGREFLGSEYPVICGAMTWVSDPELVAAVCNAGGFGILAGGNTPVDILEEQIRQTKELTDKPFGLNLITLAPVYQEHLEMLKRIEIKHVTFAGGLPKKNEIELAKSIGAKVTCFAPALSFARRLVNFGADALVIEGMEAGGHIGYVTTTILLQEILLELRDQVPVFVAGGIATGELSAHMLTMGAAGVQLGTRFACSEECNCHDNFRDRFLKANAREAVSTPQLSQKLPVTSVRAINNAGMESFSQLQLDLLAEMDSGSIDREKAQHRLEEFWMGALRRAVKDGDVDNGSLMAGQSIGLVKKSETCAEIITDINTGVEAELNRIKAQF